MENIEFILIKTRQLLWGGPLIILIAAMGVYLTFALRGIQFRYLAYSLSLLLFPQKRRSNQNAKGDLSPFQSIMTALAGAIGTGSIAGVAIAISIGGYGAIFWLWITGLFGMAISFAENTLSVKYRSENPNGQVVGGPMYTLLNGLKSKKLAKLFALLGAIAAFGIGATVQSNSSANALVLMFDFPPLATGIILSFVSALVIMGGVRSIGHFASITVPLMSILYVGASLVILGMNASNILPALKMIITSAFSGQAPVGGFVGASFLYAIQMGAARAVFSSEAGLGSSPIAAASAKTDYPAEQGMLAMSGVFMSSLIICTMTGLVLAVTQVLGQTNGAGQLLSGAALTITAFASTLKIAPFIVLGCLVFFGLTTILTWAYYGEKCIEFLLGDFYVKPYRVIYIGLIVCGAILNLHLVWAFADIANGLMCIPNLIAIAALLKVVQSEAWRYQKLIKPACHLKAT